MTGVRKLLFVIIPVTILLCFLAYGINIIIPDSHITYLTQEKIVVNGTYETYWHYDFKKYMNSINIDYFTNSLNDLKGGLEKFVATFKAFGDVWKKGYKIGNITKTIANICILIINVMMLPLNLAITIIRIISGLILTLFSLIGININEAKTPLTSFFRFITNEFKPFKYLDLVGMDAQYYQYYDQNIAVENIGIATQIS